MVGFSGRIVGGLVGSDEGCFGEVIGGLEEMINEFMGFVDSVNWTTQVEVSVASAR